jgi:hypothetical protein
MNDKLKVYRPNRKNNVSTRVEELIRGYKEQAEAAEKRIPMTSDPEIIVRNRTYVNVYWEVAKELQEAIKPNK